MPIDFPTSPTTGQIYTYQGKSWVYNGTGWDVPRALNEIGAVRTFANAADRTAAIPSPSEGIVTYLNDVDALQVHNGSAWVSNYGMTLLSTNTFTDVGSVTIDNIFTNQFRNYKIVFTIDTVSAGSGIFMRFRSGGTTTSAGYNSTNAVFANTFDAKTRYATNNAGEILVCSQDMFGSKFGEINIYSPQLSTRTFLTQVGGSRTACMSLGAGDQVDTTAFDGFVLFASGNITGTFSVYGLRN
jgi:hypothetical protein